MKDLTKDSVTQHIFSMAIPAAVSMLAQVAHQIVTLYFVSKVGTSAVAAVSSAANVGFIVGALAQVLNAGTAALVAYSAGKKEVGTIRLIHNQSLGLAIVCALGTVVMLCGLAPLYMAALSQDPEVVDIGIRFLWWAAPGYGLILPMSVLAATLRGVGVVKVPMLIMTFTLLTDAVLAFLLIPGRGFLPALRVNGAAIASTLSFAVGLLSMWTYFHRTQRRIAISWNLLIPRLDRWRRILAIGLPAAAEHVLMFLSISVVYLVISGQGASTQAGFGVGFRILQLLLLPALAVSISVVPIAGQNFGARNTTRVKDVFRITAILSSSLMLVMSIIIHWQTLTLLKIFETDSSATDTAILFLQLMSWTLVAQGLVYTCAFMFQALGNTLPALVSAATRFVIFAGPALWLSGQPDFRTEQVWYLLTGSTVVQALLSLWLLRVEFRRKLQLAV